jgi:hypothetical protein
MAFVENNYQMQDSLIELNHQAVFGLFLMIGGIQMFISMLIIQAIGLYVPLIMPNTGQRRATQ